MPLVSLSELRGDEEGFKLAPLIGQRGFEAGDCEAA